MSKPANGNRSERQRRRAAIRYAEGSIAHLAPGISLADELIAERRAEARAEDLEDEAYRLARDRIRARAGR